MGIVTFSNKDILRSKVIQPGYYLVVINRVSESPSKDGKSLNYRIEDAEIVESEGGDKEFAGCPVPYWNFNSQAMGFMIPFVEAIQGEKPEAGSRFAWGSQLEGKKLYAFIDNENFEGRIINRLKNDYKHYGE